MTKLTLDLETKIDLFQPSSLQLILETLINNHGFETSQIKTDAESLAHWGKDWTKHFAPAPSVIVFPKSTEQVQSVVKLANEYGIVITPSGGRTGLSAGAVEIGRAHV